MNYFGLSLNKLKKYVCFQHLGFLFFNSSFCLCVGGQRSVHQSFIIFLKRRALSHHGAAVLQVQMCVCVRVCVFQQDFSEFHHIPLTSLWRLSVLTHTGNLQTVRSCLFVLSVCLCVCFSVVFHFFKQIFRVWRVVFSICFLFHTLSLALFLLQFLKMGFVYRNIISRSYYFRLLSCLHLCQFLKFICILCMRVILCIFFQVGDAVINFENRQTSHQMRTGFNHSNQKKK